MKSNDKLKKFILKFTQFIVSMTIKIEYFGSHNILLDEKSYENILVYNISYKTLIDARALRIRLDKIDEFIRAYDGTSYLA